MHLKRLNSCYLIVAISVMLVHAHASHGWQGGGGGGGRGGEVGFACLINLQAANTL